MPNSPTGTSAQISWLCRNFCGVAARTIVVTQPVDCLQKCETANRAGDAGGGNTTRLRGRWPHHAALKPCQVNLITCKSDSAAVTLYAGQSHTGCAAGSLVTAMLLSERAHRLTDQRMRRVGSVWHLHYREQSCGAAQRTVAAHRCWRHDAMGAKAKAAAPPGQGR